MPERFEYDPDKNPDVRAAINIASFCKGMSERGHTDLSTYHLITLFECYNQMAADLAAENREAFIAGYTHGVTMAKGEYVPTPEEAYDEAVRSELGLA